MSFPPGTEMFQFPGFASRPYGFRPGSPKREGFPHSDTRGSTIARISPRLFAACHVLHRLSAPRHPPDALIHAPDDAPNLRAPAPERPTNNPTNHHHQSTNQPTNKQRRRPRAEPSRATDKRQDNK